MIAGTVEIGGKSYATHIEVAREIERLRAMLAQAEGLLGACVDEEASKTAVRDFLEVRG